MEGQGIGRKEEWPHSDLLEENFWYIKNYGHQKE